MILDPYIYLEGPAAGKIEEMEWLMNCESGRTYPSARVQQYTCFEREKLKELGCDGVIEIPFRGFMLCHVGESSSCYRASEEIGYTPDDWRRDSESNRILTRAKFLKAVCEKEGVEWLPKETRKCDIDKCEAGWPLFCCWAWKTCPCKCHKQEEKRFTRCNNCENTIMPCADCYCRNMKKVREPEQPKEKWVNGDMLRIVDGQYVSATEKTVTHIFMDGNPHLIKSGRDYYTKSEIDQKLLGVVRVVGETK